MIALCKEAINKNLCSVFIMTFYQMPKQYLTLNIEIIWYFAEKDF